MNRIQKRSMEINLDDLIFDYTFDFGPFTSLDDRLLDIEEEFQNLSTPDKIVLLLYAEFGSFRKVANILGVSHSTIRNKILEIRLKLC